ncbi:MAG: DedA family protein [Candidatus Aenigmarchaeota archaeon]|nr:DedA family protein [Candidatus Aenigmarchaeota archaeon]
MAFAELNALILFFVNFLTDLVAAIGYPGIFVLMAMESATLPVPSEVVVPFAGYLALQGVFDFWAVVIVSSLANLAGSLVAYAVGFYLGRGFILKYGKYVLLKERVLAIAEEWFKKYGDRAVFFSRMLPVIRTFISLPAGVGKMHLPKFIFYTFIGSLPWNFTLAYLGFWLGDKWMVILDYSHWISFAVVVAVATIIILHFVRKRKSL